MVYRNGSVALTGIWELSINIAQWFLDLSVTDLNVTLCVNDTVGHEATFTTWVFVRGTTPLAVFHPADITAELGTTGSMTEWTVTEHFNDSYCLYQNVFLCKIGWYDGSDSANNIRVSLDGLSIGVYNFTIVVDAANGNSAADTAPPTMCRAWHNQSHDCLECIQCGA